MSDSEPSGPTATERNASGGFPPGFLWGSATAAHQVEGQNFNNDWWDWEQTPGHIKIGDSSRVACDWWNGRYRDDFALARSLGHNTHRLSVEWSRVEPRAGEWDPVAWRFYRDLLAEAHANGLTPLVSLHHFTTPRWLAEHGGWENPAVAGLFARMAGKAVLELGEQCTFWVTLNEPVLYARNGYLEGAWPPGHKSLGRTQRVMANLLRAHAAAYHALKAAQPAAQVGMAHHLRVFLPYRSALDRLMARFFHWTLNRAMLLALEDGCLRFPLGTGRAVPEARGTQDFIGVNYYFSEQVAFDVKQPGALFRRPVPQAWATARQAALQWFGLGDPNPQGLSLVLRELSNYGKPIYITENGLFASDDDMQARYLVSHVAAVQRAVREGAAVRGYYWWTLVDNFEWTEGYRLRFGLFQLDLETQQRTPREVAGLYARIIRENGVADELLERYGQIEQPGGDAWPLPSPSPAQAHD